MADVLVWCQPVGCGCCFGFQARYLVSFAAVVLLRLGTNLRYLCFHGTCFAFLSVKAFEDVELGTWKWKISLASLLRYFDRGTCTDFTIHSVSTWALEEARRRLEAEGVLPDPSNSEKKN